MILGLAWGLGIFRFPFLVLSGEFCWQAEDTVYCWKNTDKVNFFATCNLQSSYSERGLSNLDHILHYLFSKRIKLIRKALPAGDNDQTHSGWLHCPHRNLCRLGFLAPTKFFFPSRRHFWLNVLQKKNSPCAKRPDTIMWLCPFESIPAQRSNFLSPPTCLIP